MAPRPPLDSLDDADKDALIQALLAHIEEFCARLAAMEAENAALRALVSELEAKLNLPKKTPDNSGAPPSRGQRPSASGAVTNESTGDKQRKSHKACAVRCIQTRRKGDCRPRLPALRHRRYEPQFACET